MYGGIEGTTRRRLVGFKAKFLSGMFQLGPTAVLKLVRGVGPDGVLSWFQRCAKGAAQPKEKRVGCARQGHLLVGGRFGQKARSASR